MPWADPEVRRLYHKAYNQKNRARARELRLLQTPEQKLAHAEYMRDYQYQRQYGITTAEYERMFREQDGKCAICQKEESTPGRRLSVDHCHETGRVRKLLCGHCNRALGWFEKYEEMLRPYIAKFKES